MKLIHHKLEDGPFADPVETDFSSNTALLYSVGEAVYEGEYPPKSEVTKHHQSKVFLLAHGDDACASDGEVYITTNRLNLVATLSDWQNTYPDMDVSIIHLQEYESFEQAYNVAIAMREGHPLCYSPETIAED